MIITVIPAFDEERFIGSVVIRALKFSDVVLVVDDGSTEMTAEIAEIAGAKVIRLESNRGKGFALNIGLREALKYDPTVIVTLDGDWQHAPKDIPNLIKPILDGEADMVVGSRYLDGNGKRQVPGLRAWGHRGFNLLSEGVTGVRTSDSQSGFRAFHPKALAILDFSSEDFSIETEMFFLVREYGLRLIEVPIQGRYLDKPKRSLFMHGMKILMGSVRLVGQYRPLLFFGSGGLLTIVGGLLWMGWVIARYGQLHQLATGHAILAVFLLIVGVISLSTGIILHSVRGMMREYMKKSDFR